MGITFNKWIIYISVFLVPVVVLPGMLNNIFDKPKTLLILFSVCLLIILNVQKLNKMSGLLLMLIGFNLFSNLYTLNPYYTKVACVLNISCIMVLFFISEEIQDLFHVKHLLYAITASGVVVTGFVFCQFFDIFPLMPFMEKGGLITGTIGNSNYVGAYMLFPLFAVSGLMFLINGKLRPILIAVFVLMVLALIITRARSAWVAFAVSYPVFLYVIYRITGHNAFNLGRAVIYLSACLLCVTIAWSLLPEYWKYDRVPVMKSLDVTTLKFRYGGYWPPAWELFKENPVFGTGLWSYRNMVYDAQAMINERTKGDFFKNTPNPKPRRAHNDWLEALVDGGIVGAGLCFAVLYGIISSGVVFVKQSSVVGEKIAVTAMLFCLIAILINAVFFFPFRLNSTLFMTVVVMGASDGIVNSSGKL